MISYHSMVLLSKKMLKKSCFFYKLNFFISISCKGKRCKFQIIKSLVFFFVVENKVLLDFYLEFLINKYKKIIIF